MQSHRGVCHAARALHRALFRCSQCTCRFSKNGGTYSVMSVESIEVVALVGVATFFSASLCPVGGG
eukprot:4468561-Amphidinium_carterae.1